VFSTFAVGGPQVRFAALARGLGEQFEHVVVSLDGACGAGRLVPPGVRLRRPPQVPTRGLGRFRSARAALREERPDLLVTYNWGAIEWALADRFRPVCPHLHAVDGFGPEEAGRQLRRRLWLRRLALSGATTVVVPSQTLRKLAIDSWRLDPGKVHHVPNGVDAGALEAQACSPLAVRRQPDERVFGTLCGLRPEKNLARLLKIAALLPNDPPWRLAIGGDGAGRAALEAQARALGLSERVDFLGFVASPGALLGALDLFVLTSDTEQMPLSVLEAMALGLPVLATDVGDLRAMLPEQSRATCLFAPADQAGFAGRLAALLAAPAERARLGALNRVKAAEYRLDTMIARYDRLFRCLAEPR
jgi:glycosyltransferase involved in cell wall biosynthesis